MRSSSSSCSSNLTLSVSVAPDVILEENPSSASPARRAARARGHGALSWPDARPLDGSRAAARTPPRPAPRAATDVRRRLRSLHPRTGGRRLRARGRRLRRTPPTRVGVANGTDALVLALRALGVEPGDEVICPRLHLLRHARGDRRRRRHAGLRRHRAGHASSSTPPRSSASSRARAGRRGRAPLRPSGADRRACARSATRAGVPMLEDAAQAIGARLGDRPCGALGAAATFSFFPTKNLGGFGDGGLVTTDDAGGRGHGAHPALPRLAGQADVRARRHELAPRRAAGGAPARAAARARRAGTPRAGRRPSATASWASASTSSCRRRAGRHAADLPPLRRAHGAARRGSKAALQERGIGATVYYGRPQHLQPVFAHLGYREGCLPETERAAREALALPMFPTIRREQQEEVVAGVRSAMAARRA